MVKGKECTSCGRRIANIPNSTAFPCPNCAKVEIVRCGECKEQGTKYKCSECGFEGP